MNQKLKLLSPKKIMKIIFSGKAFIPVVIKLQNYTHANVNSMKICFTGFNVAFVATLVWMRRCPLKLNNFQNFQ